MTATTAGYNTAVGHGALRDLTAGVHDGNTAIGYDAGHDTTTASGSVFIGALAGYDVTTGNRNIAVGYSALNNSSNTTGDNNIAIGAYAGDAITSGANNIVIGQGVDVSSATTSNETVIGNSSQQSVTFTNATGSFGGSVTAKTERNFANASGIGEFLAPKQGFTLASGATKTVSIGVGAALIVVYFNGTGPGGLVFATWTSGTIVELADQNSYIEITDTGSKLAIFKSGNTDEISFKNNSGGSYQLNLAILGARSA